MRIATRPGAFARLLPLASCLFSAIPRHLPRQPLPREHPADDPIALGLVDHVDSDAVSARGLADDRAVDHQLAALLAVQMDCELARVAETEALAAGEHEATAGDVDRARVDGPAL